MKVCGLAYRVGIANYVVSFTRRDFLILKIVGFWLPELRKVDTLSPVFFVPSTVLKECFPVG